MIVSQLEKISGRLAFLRRLGPLQITESDLTPDLVPSLTKFWVKRDQIRSEEVSKLINEEGISREEADIAFEIETFQMAEILYQESVVEKGSNHRRKSSTSAS